MSYKEECVITSQRMVTQAVELEVENGVSYGGVLAGGVLPVATYSEDTARIWSEMIQV